jgi:Mrp family chromosome partitioning ATPase
MIHLSEYLEVEHIYAQALRKQSRTLAVCAANAGEGVTTVAMALARRYASPGHKTLLVDMNYCRPALDQRFALPRQVWGLEDNSLEDAIEAHPCGLDVLTASLSVDSSLRQQDRLMALIQHWQTRYSMVVFDTSPLNAVNRQNIPAEHIAGAVDGCVLVLQSAVTKEADILQALSKLKSHQVEPIGWVMNDLQCPALAVEMRRELARISRFAPRMARWLEQKILNNDLINQVI